MLALAVFYEFYILFICIFMEIMSKMVRKGLSQCERERERGEEQVREKGARTCSTGCIRHWVRPYAVCNKT